MKTRVQLLRSIKLAHPCDSNPEDNIINFDTPEQAETFRRKMIKLGYDTQIVTEQNNVDNPCPVE